MADENKKGLEKTIEETIDDSVDNPINPTPPTKIDYLKTTGKGLALPISTIIECRRDEARALSNVAKAAAWIEVITIISNHDNIYMQGLAGLVLMSQGAYSISKNRKTPRKHY